MSFIRGVIKTAALSETHRGNATLDALVGMVPFGTTVSTVVGDRPEGHSRLSEFVHRAGGAALGGLAGGIATRRRGGVLIGSALGEFIGSKASTKKHYDAHGKLKHHKGK